MTDTLLFIVNTDYERRGLARVFKHVPNIHVATYFQVPSIRADVIIIYPCRPEASDVEREMFEDAIRDSVLTRQSGPDAKVIRL